MEWGWKSKPLLQLFIQAGVNLSALGNSLAACEPFTRTHYNRDKASDEGTLTMTKKEMLYPA